ncbi:hypothetical protein EJ02DRAFT_132376 [Clathrospora elynae]|uniref:Uncharacterized protein n=1 Tax=Clathrospora elynae TaxID=706981 RepID=A0A6A5S6V8_9PLEO|nr:hypothetical protein EJ02DRAFT_132376 [Clathrospora elynae]
MNTHIGHSRLCQSFGCMLSLQGQRIFALHWSSDPHLTTSLLLTLYTPLSFNTTLLTMRNLTLPSYVSLQESCHAPSSPWFWIGIKQHTLLASTPGRANFSIGLRAPKLIPFSFLLQFCP